MNKNQTDWTCLRRKKKIFQIFTKSILVLTCMTSTKVVVKKLQVHINRCLRFIFGIGSLIVKWNIELNESQINNKSWKELNYE